MVRQAGFANQLEWYHKKNLTAIEKSVRFFLTWQIYALTTSFPFVSFVDFVFLVGDKSEVNYLLLKIDTSDGKVLNSELPLSYNKGWNELFFNAHSRNFMLRANDPPKFTTMFMDYIVSIGKETTPYIKPKSENLTTEKLGGDPNPIIFFYEFK